MKAKKQSKPSSAIVTNQELQAGISERLRMLDKKDADLGAVKTYFTGAGKMLAAVRRDMEAAERIGSAYFPHTKRFLDIQ